MYASVLASHQKKTENINNDSSLKSIFQNFLNYSPKKKNAGNLPGSWQEEVVREVSVGQNRAHGGKMVVVMQSQLANSFHYDLLKMFINRHTFKLPVRRGSRFMKGLRLFRHAFPNVWLTFMTKMKGLYK